MVVSEGKIRCQVDKKGAGDCFEVAVGDVREIELAETWGGGPTLEFGLVTTSGNRLQLWPHADIPYRDFVAAILDQGGRLEIHRFDDGKECSLDHKSGCRLANALGRELATASPRSQNLSAARK